MLPHEPLAINCGACGSRCAGSEVSAKSAIDHSYGTFKCCTTCGSLRVIDRIDYEGLYNTRDSSNYADAGNPLFITLKQVHLWLSHRSLVKTLEPNIKILDYGCGGGELANALNRLGFLNLYSCDIQQHRPPTLDPVVRYAELTSVKDSAPFDFIFVRHVLEHIRDPVATLTELATYLRPKGRISIEVPLASSFFRTLMVRRWPGYFYPYHIHVFSEQGLQALAIRCGLVTVATEYRNPPILGVFFMSFGLSRNLARLMSLLLYPLQWGVSSLVSRSEAIRVVLGKS